MSEQKARFCIMSDEEFQAWWAKAKRFNLKNWLRWKKERLQVWLWYITHPKFSTQNKAGEISGFGGGYEQTCRTMLKAGMYWLEANPDAEPRFMGNDSVYGLILEDNEDARALSKVVTKHTPDVTGAMHHAVICRLLWIRKNSWEKYVEAQLED